MAIQHKDIPDANLHEPKGVSLATNKSVYKANGAGSGAWSKITDADQDYSDKTKNKFGWNDVSDSLYTSGSPLSIGSGVRTKLTNNGLAAQSDITRLGALWSTANNNFLVNDLNALYFIRVNCKVKAAAAAGTPYVVTFEAESANGPTVISGNTQIIKGGGYVNQLSWTSPFYIGSFINNQSISIFLTADTPITLYDIGFVIHRSYVET